jgi:alanine-glyoxylate transaminase/serine-glyoxylate transaminase/serine-pyruvate transaminase
METTVANVVREGTRALVVVTGYFGDRLAQMCERYGATVTRLDVEWGRACDPDALRRQLKATPAGVVAMVHAETSTGVLNPVQQLAAIAREHGALTIVDAVTSFGGQPLDVGAWGIDACYSCTQKCLGGPSGLAPVVFGPRALEQRVKCRSFYFDLTLLEDYWVRRKYHHTMSSTMIYALYEALAIVEEEGLDARWQRHERNHKTLLESLRG